MIRVSLLVFGGAALFCLASGIVIGGDHSHSYDSSSSSSSDSSDESRGGKHHHHHHSGKGGHGGGRGGHGGGRGGHGGNGRPPGRPPRPASTPAPEPKCEPGWTLFKRQMGSWCIQLYPGAVGQADAENACRSVGAVLSSVENAEERATISSIGMNMMLPTGWKFGTIRTGTKRDAIGSPWYTTDQFTTGMGGVVWSPAEPNNGYWMGRPNNCALLWLWVPGGKQEGQRIYGTFFAMECLTSPPDRWRGFVCGKKAT
ncbi:unnamed protein product [Caenorhabditis brenneri]